MAKAVAMRYQLVCAEGFRYIGYQQCVLWAMKDGLGGRVENASQVVVSFINLCRRVLRVDGTNDAPELILADRGKSFFVQSGEGFTLEDLGEYIGDILQSPVECIDGGDATTLKVGGKPFSCQYCTSTVFRACHPGEYKCVGCGAFFGNTPPILDKEPPHDLRLDPDQPEQASIE